MIGVMEHWNVGILQINTGGLLIEAHLLRL
jgi:hypothetical protein